MPTATNKAIGHADCPNCSSSARVSETGKRKLAYLTCDQCGTQMFTRGFDADKALRERMTAVEEETEEPVPNVTQPDVVEQPKFEPEPEPEKPAKRMTRGQRIAAKRAERMGEPA